jgi:hypothetical protein
MNATTEPTTTPASLSARLATMAEQVRGMADAMEPEYGEDPAELSALASALTAASQDAAALEAQIPKRDAKVARWMNAYPTNADGEG